MYDTIKYTFKRVIIIEMICGKIFKTSYKYFILKMFENLHITLNFLLSSFSCQMSSFEFKNNRKIPGSRKIQEVNLVRKE